ncbi:4'-phosphopantetheinyl transferase family protein [Geodermatophilus sp. FMUSA9-8]|uniref:4'-phosphopantetheinyl transferase family protein n=1 Tax=Geodermatophilus sp. FMUSA9-8 TaxID=3120155 RepID=UPI00300BDDB8
MPTSLRPSLPAPLHVWSVDLADDRWDEDAAAARLTPGERAAADRGVAAVRRRRVLVRAVLRTVLGDLLGLAPADVPLEVRGGRPLVRCARRGPGVSCSAAGGLALVAVAPRAGLGVDLEPAGPGPEGDEWLAAPELARLAGRAGEGTGGDIERTRAWTAKEAVLKAEGTGLRRDPRTVVTPAGGRGRLGSWWLAPLPVPAGWVATAALDRRWDPARARVRPLTPERLR